jgi:hypothetical protein
VAAVATRDVTVAESAPLHSDLVLRQSRLQPTGSGEIAELCRGPAPGPLET